MRSGASRGRHGEAAWRKARAASEGARAWAGRAAGRGTRPRCSARRCCWVARVERPRWSTDRRRRSSPSTASWRRDLSLRCRRCSFIIWPIPPFKGRTISLVRLFISLKFNKFLFNHYQPKKLLRAVNNFVIIKFCKNIFTCQ